MTTLDELEQQTLTKRCARCGEVKSLEGFPPLEHTRDGRHSWCHACHTKYARERRWAQKGIAESEWPRLHQEADRKAAARTKRPRPVKRQRIMRGLAKQHGLKYCPGCDMCLGKAFFHRSSRSADGLQSYCKACQLTRVADYHRTPAGRAAVKGCKHRRRAKLRELPTDGTTPRDWAAWAEEHEWFQCHLCGGDLNADDEIHWDHVEPVSTGSAGTVLHNMRAAHAWCNLSRGNRPIDEWRAAMGLTEEIP